MSRRSLAMNPARAIGAGFLLWRIPHAEEAEGPQGRQEVLRGNPNPSPETLFKPGNSLWKQRGRSGIRPIFASADELWEACAKYFECVEANPLLEVKPFAVGGQVKMIKTPKARAMTTGGLCVFLGVSDSAWHSWRSHETLGETVKLVEAIMRAQKFEGAAAGLFQPMIIARDLGLADRSELSGVGGGPIQTQDVSPADKVRARLDAIAGRATGGASEDGA